MSCEPVRQRDDGKKLKEWKVTPRGSVHDSKHVCRLTLLMNTLHRSSTYSWSAQIVTAIAIESTHGHLNIDSYLGSLTNRMHALTALGCPRAVSVWFASRKRKYPLRLAGLHCIVWSPHSS